MPLNRQILLHSRPDGMPTPDNFRLVESAVPAPGEGQVLLRNLYLSLDPYQRGRMDASENSYVPPIRVGGVMEAGTVSEVVESRAPDFAPGDIVVSYTGWQDYALVDPLTLEKIQPADDIPPSWYLGVLGMPGMTAWVGMWQIADPKQGETVVVSAAAGAVGSVAGQLAAIRGARVVGIAGGPHKCAVVTDEFEFDECLNYHADQFPQLLRHTCPKGIDVYFENVGGAVSRAVWPLLNRNARVAVCGLIAHYNDTELPPGPDRSVVLMRDILIKRLRVQGFIVSDWFSRTGEFRQQMLEWLREGKIGCREDVAVGLQNAPDAFIGMLRGRNVGKMIVRLDN